LHIGDFCTGYIHSLREEDSLIALSLSPIGFDALVDKHKEALLKALKDNNGFYPFPMIHLQRKFERILG